MNNPNEEDGRTGRSKLLLVSCALLLAASASHAQTADVISAAADSGVIVVTNVSQITPLFDSWAVPLLVYPYEPVMFDGIDGWWLDFTQLPDALAAVRSYWGRQMEGVTQWPLRLIRAADTGEIVLQYPFFDLELLRIQAPTNYVPFQQYNTVLGTWCQLYGKTSTSYEDLVATGNWFLEPPRVVLDVWVADVNDWPTYNDNVMADQAAAQEAEQEAATTTSDDARATLAGGSLAAIAENFGGGMMAMNNEPCVITDDSQAFGVVNTQWTPDAGFGLSFESCRDHVYLILVADSLNTNTTWTPVAWMRGLDGQTSWTDTNSVGVGQRFYKVQRLTQDGDEDGDGIPNGWEVDHGLNPLDWTDADEPSTNPWAHGLTNLQVYENPSVLIADNYSTLNDGIPDWWKVTYDFSVTDTNVAAADPDGDGFTNLQEYQRGSDPQCYDGPDIVVNGGSPYTGSLTVTIQPLSTSYPNIRVALDPSMTNATILANSGGPINYALPDNGDGLYSLHVQYADAQGQPSLAVLTKTVTLDRLAPVVDISSPAVGQVIDQAFIDLHALAYDADPSTSDVVRPLTVWINGAQFWDRTGTNIVIERFPVPTGTNSFTVTISAEDQAGNSNVVSRTWVVDPSGDTVAPVTSNLSPVADAGLGATGGITVPDQGAFWLQGYMDDSNAIATASVNGGDPVTMNVVSNHFGGLVPLDSSTNILVVVASDAAGNATSNTFVIVSTNRFIAAITSPEFGSFANGQSNIVSGYVSAKIDAGLPTETNLVAVTVNGVATTLHWDQIDSNGNVPFDTAGGVPPPTGDFASLDVYTLWANGEQHTTPLGMQQGYEVLSKSSGYDFLSADFANYNNCLMWGVGNASEDLYSNVFNEVSGSPGTFQEYLMQRTSGHQCFDLPEFDRVQWGSWGAPSYVYAGTDYYPRSLGFGSWQSDWYSHRVWDGYDIFDRDLDTDTGSLTFRAPVQYAPNTTVIFTFEGVNYARLEGVPLDLSQIQYRGQNPIAWSNELGTVSYLINVDGGRTYTIGQENFQWPSFTTNSAGDYYIYYTYPPYSPAVSEFVTSK